MSRNFARFVRQFRIQTPIILDSFKLSVPMAEMAVQAPGSSVVGSKAAHFIYAAGS